MMPLFVALLFLVCSIMVFFDLRYPILWKISIGTTEYGHWFAAAPLFIACFTGWEDALSATTTIISLMTIGILLFPHFSAMIISRSLPSRFDRSFRNDDNVKNGGSPFQWRRLWSTAVQAVTVPVREVYAHNGGEEQYLKFFRSVSDKPLPCIVVVHTGGWDSGSPDEFETMNQYLASRGYAVASISYRFAPKWKWPAQKEDALAGIAFLKTNAARLGIDASQFVLFGRSAGGQIAEAAAYSAHDPAIKGCIAFYAPADMNFAYEHLSSEPDILDSRTLLQNYLGGSQEEVRNNYDDASPYDHVSSDSPPTLLIHGAKDPLTWYRQSERLSKKLTELSVPHLYIELPWGTHAFDYNFNGPGGQISRYAVERFLRSVVESRVY
ncbi:MAG: alpha/beta hydrolase [Bacteroidota bacterium]